MCPSSSQMSIQHGLSSETCRLQKGYSEKSMAHNWGSIGWACRHYHKRWFVVVLEIYVEKCWTNVLEIHCSAWPQTHNIFHGHRIQWKCLVRERDDHKKLSCMNHYHKSWGLYQQCIALFLIEEEALGKKNWGHLQLVGGTNLLVVAVSRMVHDRHL